MEVLIALIALASLPYVVVVGGLVGFAVDENGVGPILTAPFHATTDDELWCDRYDLARGHERFPVLVPPTDPRSEVTQNVDVLACSKRLVRAGQRSPLVDALLLDLDERTSSLATLALPLVDNPKRIFVEAFTPDLALSQKVASAARTALSMRGLPVQRLAPMPAAADVEVMRGLPAPRGIALSCERLFAEGQLVEGDLYVVLAVLDPIETALHVGACTKGRFAWLQ
jgi:hypothetical protein